MRGCSITLTNIKSSGFDGLHEHELSSMGRSTSGRVIQSWVTRSASRFGWSHSRSPGPFQTVCLPSGWLPRAMGSDAQQMPRVVDGLLTLTAALRARWRRLRWSSGVCPPQSHVAHSRQSPRLTGVASTGERETVESLSSAAPFLPLGPWGSAGQCTRSGRWGSHDVPTPRIAGHYRRRPSI